MEDPEPISCGWSQCCHIHDCCTRLLLCTALVGCAPPANVAFAISEARGSVRDVRVETLRDNTASGRWPIFRRGVVLDSPHAHRHPRASGSVVYAAATSASRYQSSSSADRSEQADWTRLRRSSDRFRGTQSTPGVCGSPGAGQVPQDRLALRQRVSHILRVEFVI